MTKIERGIVSGLAATVPMTVTMGVFQKVTHPADRIAPSEVVHRAEEMANLDQETEETAHETVTGVAHFAFGAAAGAHFGLAGPSRIQCWQDSCLGHPYMVRPILESCRN